VPRPPPEPEELLELDVLLELEELLELADEEELCEPEDREDDDEEELLEDAGVWLQAASSTARLHSSVELSARITSASLGRPCVASQRDHGNTIKSITTVGFRRQRAKRPRLRRARGVSALCECVRNNLFCVPVVRRCGTRSQVVQLDLLIRERYPFPLVGGRIAVDTVAGIPVVDDGRIGE
jgi:hypothetical protein